MELGILLGVITSALVELLKRFGLSGSWATIAVAAVLSLVGAATFRFAPNFWVEAGTVFATATTFYAVLIKQLTPSNQ